MLEVAKTQDGWVVRREGHVVAGPFVRADQAWAVKNELELKLLRRAS